MLGPGTPLTAARGCGRPLNPRRRMPRMGRTLASWILIAVVGIIAVTMAIGLALFTQVASSTVDHNAIEQARSIAVSLGHVPSVAAAVEAGDPQRSLRSLGESVRRDAGASYVVII